MIRKTKAIYEQGALRLAEPLPLADGTPVEVTVISSETDRGSLQETDKSSSDALTQLLAEERNQILSDAPGLWQQIATSVANEVAEFTTRRPEFLSMLDQSGSSGKPFFKLSVASHQRSIEAKFTERYPPRINYEVTQNQRMVVQDYFLFLFSDGRVMIRDGFGTPYSVLEAAKLLLGYLVPV